MRVIFGSLLLTSVHGLANIVHPPGKHKLVHRILWTLILLGSSALSVYLLSKRFNNYLSQPRSTETSSSTMQQVQFPAVVICNRNQLRISALIEKGLIQNISARNVKQSLSSDLKLLPVLPHLAHQLNDLLYKCEFESKPCRPDLFQPVMTEAGQCYGLNLNGSMNISSDRSGDGLLVILNTESHEYLQQQKHIRDSNLKNFFEYNYQPGVYVLIDWATDLQTFNMRKAGKFIEAGHAVSFVLQASESEYDPDICAHLTHQSAVHSIVDHFRDYFPDNPAYTKNKCEQIGFVQSVYNACGYQKPFAPFANRTAAEMYTLKQWLMEDPNIVDWTKTNGSIKCNFESLESAARANASEVAHKHDTDCSPECYAMHYEAMLVYNTLKLSEPCTDLPKVQNKSRLCALHDKARAKLDEQYRKIERMRDEMKSGLDGVFDELLDVYDMLGATPIFSRTNPVALHMIPDQSVDSDEVERNKSYTINKLFPICQILGNESATPTDVARILHRLWTSIEEFLVSPTTWKKFYVVRRDDDEPFKFLSALPTKDNELEELKTNLNLSDKIRAKFDDIQTWFHKLHPELQKAIVKFHYPIQKSFHWQCPTYISEAVGEKTVANDAPTTWSGNTRHVFWQCLAQLRKLFESRCLALQPSSTVADRASEYNATLMNCSQISSELHGLYDTLPSEQEFIELQRVVRNDRVMQIFSENAPLWVVEPDVLVHLPASVNWPRLYELIKEFGSTEKHSFSALATLLDREKLVTELNVDERAFDQALKQFEDLNLKRNLRKVFGLGPAVPKNFSGSIRNDEETNEDSFANDHMVRYLRATDSQARELFDVSALHDLSECFEQYRQQIRQARTKMKEAFENAKTVFLFEMRAKVDAASMRLVKSDMVEEWYRQNFVQIRVRFAHTVVKTTKQRISYDFWALLSDSGGAVGLTIGASIITAFELLYIVVIYVGGIVWKKYKSLTRVGVLESWQKQAHEAWPMTGSPPAYQEQYHGFYSVTAAAAAFRRQGNGS